MARAYKVLVVDDEVPIRSSLVDFFHDEGLDAMPAESAENGWKILESHQMDAAVVDIRLPGADGNAFIIHAHTVQPELSFVIYTGSTDYVLPEDIQNVGVKPQDVFHKPLHDIGILTEAIQRVIARKDGDDGS